MEKTIVITSPRRQEMQQTQFLVAPASWLLINIM